MTVISDIQTEYMRILKAAFFSYYQIMLSTGKTPATVASEISDDIDALNLLYTKTDYAFEKIDMFWKEHGDTVFRQLSVISGSQTIYGGNYFPSVNDTAYISSLYFDTLLLPDPVTRILNASHKVTREMSACLCMAHALSVIHAEDLILSKSPSSQCIILPSIDYYPMISRAQLEELTGRVFIEQASIILGVSFSSVEDVDAYLDIPDTKIELVKSIERPKLLVLADEPGPIHEQLARMEERLTKGLLPEQQPKRPGDLIRISLHGRVQQANEMLLKSHLLDASPLASNDKFWSQLELAYQFSSSGQFPRGNLTRDVDTYNFRQVALSPSATSYLRLKSIVQIRERDDFSEFRAKLWAQLSATAHPDRSLLRESVDELTDRLQQAAITAGQEESASVGQAAIAGANLGFATYCCAIGVRSVDSNSHWIETATQYLGNPGIPGMLAAGAAFYRAAKRIRVPGRSPSAILLKKFQPIEGTSKEIGKPVIKTKYGYRKSHDKRNK